MIPTITSIIIILVLFFKSFRRRVMSRRRSLRADCRHSLRADCRRYVPSCIRYVPSVVHYEPSTFVANRRPCHVPIACKIPYRPGIFSVNCLTRYIEPVRFDSLGIN